MHRDDCWRRDDNPDFRMSSFSIVWEAALLWDGISSCNTVSLAGPAVHWRWELWYHQWSPSYHILLSGRSWLASCASLSPGIIFYSRLYRSAQSWHCPPHRYKRGVTVVVRALSAFQFWIPKVTAEPSPGRARERVAPGAWQELKWLVVAVWGV